MNQATPAQPPEGGLNLTASDIYFILFRHKTKIILIILLGLVSGATVYNFWPEEYQSEAQLLVRYVTEKREVVDSNQDTRVTSTGGRGNEHILQTEIAILNSLDLAEDVVKTIGPDNIVRELPEGHGGPLAPLAANIVADGIEAGGRSNIINLTFTHADPTLPQTVLRTTIDTYIEKHVSIHRARGGTFDDFLTQQTDQLKAKLNQTENELLTALKRAGVMDIASAKTTLTAEMARIQQTILETEVELAENLSSIEEIQSRRQTTSRNQSNGVAELDTEENFNAELENAFEEYEQVKTALEILKSRERELLLTYTSANSLVKGVREQISDSESKIQEFENRHPEILESKIVTAAQGGNPLLTEANLLRSQQIRVRGLQTRLEVLAKQLESLRERANQIETAELAVRELERRKNLEETNYQNFLTSLERTRLDEALSAGKINNITVIQNPTPVRLALSQKIKFAGGATAAIAALGLVWAFAWELFIDRTVKRPIEIQRDVGLPLFLTLPDTKGKTFRKLYGRSSSRMKLLTGKKKAAKAKTSERYTPKSSTLQAAAKSNPEMYGAKGSETASNGEIAPWDEHYPLHNYFEALRDKVISYFESKNLQHKPKLIGLTGLGEDPGVSTIASGVASSLSKTEGGNVLLVDMTLGKESAQQFYKGEEVSDLEEALDKPQRAQLQENLYVVAEGSNGYKLPKLLPSRLNSIIPKLKASDFDYIVFDMPAVSPISATPRLASFMDVMLMVVESEKTDKEVVKQAAELLSESKAHLGAVLNKTKSYVPRQLEQDFIGLS